MSIRKIGLMSAALGLAALTFALPASAQDASQSEPTYPTNTITVSGTGEAYGAPDVAYVSLGVDFADEDISKAVNQTNTVTQQIIDAVKGTGVAEEDIQTANFNIYP